MIFKGLLFDKKKFRAKCFLPILLINYKLRIFKKLSKVTFTKLGLTYKPQHNQPTNLQEADRGLISTLAVFTDPRFI